MPSFSVRFIKTVCDDAGGEHRACQAALDVDAASLRTVAQPAASMIWLGSLHGNAFKSSRFADIWWGIPLLYARHSGRRWPGKLFQLTTYTYSSASGATIATPLLGPMTKIGSLILIRHMIHRGSC